MYNQGGGFGGFGGFGDEGGGGGGFLGGFMPAGNSPKKSFETGGQFVGGGGGANTSLSSRDQQGLMSVTIKMVLEQSMSSEGGDSASGVLRFHNGHEATMLEIVAQVESVETEQVFLKYLLDDGTGKIVCKKYLETDPMRAASAINHNIYPGKFVRVIGPFRRYANESFITAHRVEEITNLDDLARHRIEVIHTYLLLNNMMGNPESLVGGHSGAVSSSSSVHFQPADQNMKSFPNENAYNVQPNHGQTSVGSSAWFLSEVVRVFGPRGPKFNPNTGFSRQQLYMHFVSQLTAKQVDEKIQSLHDEGHMFSTIDDNHFQLTFS